MSVMKKHPLWFQETSVSFRMFCIYPGDITILHDCDAFKRILVQGITKYKSCLPQTRFLCVPTCVCAPSFYFFFLYLDPWDQTNEMFQHLSWLSSSCRKKKEIRSRRGKRVEGKETGLISSFSAVWLPETRWPFQASRQQPSPASLHYPLLLLLPFQAQVLSVSLLSNFTRWKLE